MNQLPDISNLDIAQLRELEGQITERIEALRQAGRENLIEQLTQAASSLGFDNLDELLGRPAKRGRPRRNGKQPNPE